VSRSFHLILPTWEGEPDNVHEYVAAELLHGPRYLDVALELWSLANRQDRVKEIEALLEPAYENDLPVLHSKEIAKLETLLNDLDGSLKASFLDDEWRILPGKMNEVRSRTSLLDLDDVQGHVGADGVSEGLSRVHGLRAFLREALERGLHLVLD
jgi:hypothetical protein